MTISITAQLYYLLQCCQAVSFKATKLFTVKTNVTDVELWHCCLAALCIIGGDMDCDQPAQPPGLHRTAISAIYF